MHRILWTKPRLYAHVHNALPHEEFSTWVDNQIKVRTPLTEDDPNYEGEQLFITNCARCHAISGVTEREMNGETVADSMAMYGNMKNSETTPTVL